MSPCDRRAGSEVAELSLPLRVAAGDAHDVAVIFVAEVLVLINQGLPHAGGVLLIHAEDDGLLEAVATLPEEVGDLCRDQLGAVIENEGGFYLILSSKRHTW